MSNVASLFDQPSDPLTEIVADLVARYGWSAVSIEVAMHKPGVTAASAPARPTDPITSHQAAKTESDVGRFSRNSRQARLLSAFGAQHLTDQLATVLVLGTEAPQSQFDGCRRRCSDLRAAGYLYDTGAKMRNPGSVDDSIVWGITRAGQVALANLNEKGWSR